MDNAIGFRRIVGWVLVPLLLAAGVVEARCHKPICPGDVVIDMGAITRIMLETEAWVASQIEEQMRYIELMDTMMCNHSKLISNDNARSTNSIVRTTATMTGLHNLDNFNETFPVDSCEDVSYSRNMEKLVCAKSSSDEARGASTVAVYGDPESAKSGVDSRRDAISEIESVNATTERLSVNGVPVTGFSSVLLSDSETNDVLAGDDLEKAEHYVKMVSGQLGAPKVRSMVGQMGLEGTKKGEVMKVKADTFVARRSLVDNLASRFLEEKRLDPAIGTSVLAQKTAFVDRRMGSPGGIDWQKKISGGDGTSNEAVVLREMAMMRAFIIQQALDEFKSNMVVEAALAMDLARKLQK